MIVKFQFHIIRSFCLYCISEAPNHLIKHKSINKHFIFYDSMCVFCFLFFVCRWFHFRCPVTYGTSAPVGIPTRWRTGKRRMSTLWVDQPELGPPFIIPGPRRPNTTEWSKQNPLPSPHSPFGRQHPAHAASMAYLSIHTATPVLWKASTKKKSFWEEDVTHKTPQKNIVFS